MRLVHHAATSPSAPGRSTAQVGALSTGDPVREAIRRLRMLCFALSIVPAVMIGFVVTVAPPGSPQHDARWTTISLVCIGMALSIVVYRVLGNERLRPERRLHVGFLYQIVVALIAAVERHLIPWPEGAGFRDVSPVCIVILVFAAFIPNEPRRTLAVSLAAAAMEPVGLVHGLLRGNPAPPPIQMVALCFPPLAAALIATMISRVVYGLARGAEEARRLGSYQLVERLGEGGMGEVWRAQHKLLARPAAIKVIRPAAIGDAGSLRRFEREAHATATLQCPHTVQLFDFGVADDGTFYYVMELLDGLDLERLVRAHGPMPPERAVHVLIQVCASLEEAHRRGLVHRDVKPANIYLCAYGLEHDFVKVLDFGLVKERASRDEGAFAPTMSVTGTIAGTPAFLAPEMATGEREVDARADLYALGCVAYWLLTGALVFEGDSALKMVIEHAKSAPVAPSVRAGVALPPALEGIVLACLEKDPAARPASAAELAARLAALDLPKWTEERAGRWWADYPRTDVPPTAFAPTELQATEAAANVA